MRNSLLIVSLTWACALSPARAQGQSATEDPCLRDTHCQELLARAFLQEAEAERSKQVALLPPATSRPASERPPIYKKWWFWTVTGLAVAGTAIGLGIGLASRGPDTGGAPEYRPFSQ